MQKECISVVIPVYNAEKTIRKCLDSLIGQTYSNFELICVDDGSKDASLEICREYESKDARIRTIAQKNAGPSHARNRGLDASKGEYVCFVDSDDYVEPDYLEYLYKGLTEHDVDIATCGLRHEYEDGREHGRVREFAPHVALAEEILRPYRDTYQSFTTCKLYRRSALLRPDGTMIHYQEDIRIGEDRLFWCEVILQNQRAWISCAKKYHYIYHETSLYHAHDYEKSWEDFLGRRRMEELLQALPALRDVSVEHAADTALYVLSYDKFDARTDEILDYLRAEKRWKVYYHSDKQRNRRIQALMIGISPRLYRRVRKIRKKLSGK